MLRFARSFQGHWPKIIKVFLLLFVHKKKFFLFALLFKMIFPFVVDAGLRRHDGVGTIEGLRGEDAEAAVGVGAEFGDKVVGGFHLFAGGFGVVGDVVGLVGGGGEFLYQAFLA